MCVRAHTLCNGVRTPELIIIIIVVVDDVSRDAVQVKTVRNYF